MKQSILITAIFSFFTILCLGQEATTTKKPVLNYYKIEVGMNILDCPVLPTRLKEKLSTINGIKDYIIDKKSQSILFNIPAGVITAAQIADIATACSFPKQSINVSVDKKPFPDK